MLPGFEIIINFCWFYFLCVEFIIRIDFICALVMDNLQNVAVAVSLNITREKGMILMIPTFSSIASHPEWDSIIGTK